MFKLIGETRKQSLVYNKENQLPTPLLSMLRLWNLQASSTVVRIAEMLSKEGHKISVAHSGLARADRDREIDSFRKGDTDILVLTDAEGQAADILQGNVMVNFDLPIYSDLSSEPLRGHLRDEQYLKRMGTCYNSAFKSYSIYTEFNHFF